MGEQLGKVLAAVKRMGRVREGKRVWRMCQEGEAKKGSSAKTRPVPERTHSGSAPRGLTLSSWVGRWNEESPLSPRCPRGRPQARRDQIPPNTHFPAAADSFALPKGQLYFPTLDGPCRERSSLGTSRVPAPPAARRTPQSWRQTARPG